MKNIIFMLVLFYFSLPGIHTYTVSYLQQGDNINHTSSNDIFQIYCYSGKPKYIIHLWQTVTLQINLRNENYLVYAGSTPDEVEKEYKADNSIWSLNLFTTKQKQFVLNPFNQSCIGVSSDEEYTISLNVIRIDYWKVMRLILGVCLFLSAKRLSRNNLFYYICGISFGICASFLILIYFISKLFPRKPMMYGVAICGWTVGVYVLQLLWDNIRLILMSYQQQVACYVLLTGLISFIICYRMGPVSNTRTLNLIQWCLQLFAILLVYFSSQYREASVALLLLMIFSHNFPQTWLLKSKSYINRKFPPKIKLLSNDEYYHQGVRETSKALDELRRYCSSPECNQWKTVLKLKEAKRFASFVEGQSHLSDDEMLDYESSIHPTEFTDEEEQEEDYTDEEY